MDQGAAFLTRARVNNEIRWFVQNDDVSIQMENRELAVLWNQIVSVGSGRWVADDDVTLYESSRNFDTAIVDSDAAGANPLLDLVAGNPQVLREKPIDSLTSSVTTDFDRV